MPVSKAGEGVRLEADHIYIGLPGRPMILKEGCLHILDAQLENDPHKPIDHFGQSLASELGSDAAVVVLSGTGNDGTQAAIKIKESGGVVIAQEPSSASFDGMPTSVIQAGLTDRVLTPDQFGQVLCAWGEGKLSEGNPDASLQPVADDSAFEAILSLVRERAHRDMSGYKPSTLRRRIERRMGLQHISSLDAYLKVLRQAPADLEQLTKDLFLGVTAFFRDPEAFAIIEETIIPDLCEKKATTESIRVWIAGCSTGEEAYSIAIQLLEWFAAHDQSPRIQIFATDIDDAALEVARAGLYSEEALAGFSSERIKRYFVDDKQGYRIAKAVREIIVFASHNLISDPPFSKLDLVVCRNLLIYLNSLTQKKLLGLFHFVIKPGGYLFLGSSESIGSVGRHFQAISKQWRIYRHLDTAPRRPPQLPITTGMGTRHLPGRGDADTGSDVLAAQERLYQQLITIHGPTQVLINSRYELLFVSGDASPYMIVPVGHASHDLFKMVKPPLAMALRTAVNGAERNRARTTVSAVMSDGESNDQQLKIRIDVEPISIANQPEMLLVGFAPEATTNSTQTIVGTGGDDWVLQQLIQELDATREDLHRTLEQSRVSGEEMKAANEEVMAMNEELQSTNEELESSKEELQSLNDELSNSNNSLDAKVIEIEGLYTDLNNLINSTETATLLLDQELKIRLYTPACSQLLRVIPGDIGRTINDVVHLFNDPGLSEDCQKVMHGTLVADREIRNHDRRWYLRRILPYQGSEGEVNGVVLTFPEITSLKEADQLLYERSQVLEWQANLLSRAAPVVGRDLQDRVIFWNKGAEDLYGWPESEALGAVTHELLQTQFPVPLEQIKSKLMEKSIWKGKLTHKTRNGQTVIVESRWTPYRNELGEVQAIVEVNNDISDRIQAQEALDESETMFRTMVDWTYSWEYWIGQDGKFIHMTPSAERVTGYSVDEFQRNPRLLDAIVYPEDSYLWDRHLHHSQGVGRDDADELEMRIVRKNGEIRWVNHTCRAVTIDGHYMGRRVTVRDITAHKKAEEQIRDLANYDPLTHLPNRRLLMDRLSQALIASKRSMHYGVLMMLDLDHFKHINDTRGHYFGDRLLVQVAQRLTSVTRMEDTVARLGGDEFVIMLEGLGTSEQLVVNETELIAEKILHTLNQPYFLDDSDKEYHNTCSIGVVLFLGMDDSSEVLLKQADVALYQAKDAGRNRLCYFNPDMQAVVDARAALEAALRCGLDRQEFKLYYQPQVNQDGQLIGAEALIRWMAPETGLISPAQFIPLAEETGLILQIGQWVLDTACAQLKIWEQDPRYSTLQLSINVSARQFHQPDFTDQVRESLNVSGVNPARLKLELTESLVLENVEEMVTRMQQLNDLGVSFALDDFGTGYSSLSYLKQLPFDQIKIDQSFVRDLTQDPNDAAIVRAILAMSQSLGFEVIAEGVETPEQQDFLLQNGCRAYQGYLFGKPMPIEEWDLFLQFPPEP